MKKIASILALLLVAVMLLSACGGSGGDGGGKSPAPTDATKAPDTSSGEPAAPEPRTLAVGTLDSADGFDPTTNSNCGLGLSLVYDPILILDYETNEIKPNLALSIGFVDDLTFELVMRDDVHFSNGELMTPEDVMYSLSRFVFENTQFETGFDNIDFDATTIDGNKITIKLHKPDPDFAYKLSNDRWASVLCKSYVESTDKEAFWDAPVGTGAYVCVENVAGSHATYKRRDDYWGELPEPETITIKYYSEITTMMVDFENKVLDIVLNVGVNEYDQAAGGAYSDTEVKLLPAYDNLSVTMPQYMEVFQDIRVRQAVAMALDVEGITKAVFGSLGTVADSCLIKGMEYYVPIRVNEYNPERAKELLAEAGYEPGELTLLMLFPSMPINDKASTIIQAQLKEVGINLNIETGDFATVIPRLMNNECELGLSGTGGGTFIASSIFKLIGEEGTNGSVRMADEEFNKYIREGNTSIDPAVRAEAYKKAQQWVAANYWYIPVAYSNGAVLYHTNVDNVTGLTARSVNLKFVTYTD
ncbi:MAG: ABC transporter substrate-binding protein [Oscillospiraceae bacterium]|jgi:peptide/nickel transport system substrate-binding protein